MHSFGLTYRTGTNHSLWRFNTLMFNGRNSETTADSLNNKKERMGAYLKFGKEFRKGIDENFELRYGLDLSFSYSYWKQDEKDVSQYGNSYYSESTTYSPGMNFVFGVNYFVGDALIIGAEILPYFEYEMRESVYGEDKEKRDITGISYGISNKNVLLSVVYKF